jgi:hypothetical protein
MLAAVWGMHGTEGDSQGAGKAKKFPDMSDQQLRAHPFHDKNESARWCGPASTLAKTRGSRAALPKPAATSAALPLCYGDSPGIRF